MLSEIHLCFLCMLWLFNQYCAFLYSYIWLADLNQLGASEYSKEMREHLFVGGMHEMWLCGAWTDLQYRSIRRAQIIYIYLYSWSTQMHKNIVFVQHLQSHAVKQLLAHDNIKLFMDIAIWAVEYVGLCEHVPQQIKI